MMKKPGGVGVGEDKFQVFRSTLREKRTKNKITKSDEGTGHLCRDLSFRVKGREQRNQPRDEGKGTAALLDAKHEDRGETSNCQPFIKSSRRV